MVYSWLRVLCAVHSEYKDGKVQLADYDAAVKALAAEQERILNSIMVASSDEARALESAAGFDVSKARAPTAHDIAAAARTAGIAAGASAGGRVATAAVHAGGTFSPIFVPIIRRVANLPPADCYSLEPVQKALGALEPGLLDELVAELQRVWKIPAGGAGIVPAFDEHWVLAHSWRDGYIPVRADQEMLMGAIPGHVETHIDKRVLGRFTLCAHSALVLVASRDGAGTALPACTTPTTDLIPPQVNTFYASPYNQMYLYIFMTLTMLVCLRYCAQANPVPVARDVSPPDIATDTVPRDAAACTAPAVASAAAATVTTAVIACDSAGVDCDRRPRLGFGQYSAVFVPIIRHTVGLPPVANYPLVAVQQACVSLGVTQLLITLTTQLRKAWLLPAADHGGPAYDAEWVLARSASDGDIPEYYQRELLGGLPGGHVVRNIDGCTLGHFECIVPDLHRLVSIHSSIACVFF